MTKRELIEEVLDILRNTEQEKAIEVCCELDADYVLEQMGENEDGSN